MTNLALNRSNPKLLELEQQYAALNYFDHSNWATYSANIDIQNFRGENGFLSQLNYGMTEEHYARTYKYACALGLENDILELGEDGAFGAITFETNDGIKYSRDLLDSLLEINFLMDTLGLEVNTEIELLDIGAGYGRFIHRFSQMFYKSFSFGVDAVPISTFLCDFYLEYRKIPNAVCLPLGKLLFLSERNIGIACNMYSFGEMTLQGINFWLDKFTDLGIRYF